MQRNRLLVILYGTLVLVLVLLPLEPDPPGSLGEAVARVTWGGWSALEPLRFVGHAFVFLPMGWLLGRRRGLVAAVVLAAVAAVAGEGLQLLVAREVSVRDALANGIGLAGGIILARHRRGPSLAGRAEDVLFHRVTGATLLVAVMGLTLLLAWPVRDDLSTWDESYPFVVGDEATGDRAWDGEVEAVHVLADRTIASWSADDDRLIPHDAPAMLAEIKRHGACTIIARIRPASLEASGPARIAGFSISIAERNITLAQDGADYVLRVRNRLNGRNGHRLVARARDAVVTDRIQTVEVFTDGTVSTIQVDDELLGRATYCRLIVVVHYLFNATPRPRLVAGLLVIAAIVTGLGWYGLTKRPWPSAALTAATIATILASIWLAYA